MIKKILQWFKPTRTIICLPYASQHQMERFKEALENATPDDYIVTSKEVKIVKIK